MCASDEFKTSTDSGGVEQGALIYPGTRNRVDSVAPRANDADLFHISTSRECGGPQSTLARTIRLRNPYVDPMSFIQVELLRRKRHAASKEEVPAELDRAILLTINGLASGLRSTG